MPVGFKNGTDGSLQTALDAMFSARAPHSFLGIDQDGFTSIVRTTGNPDGHVVRRGGRVRTNYDADSIRDAEAKLAVLKKWDRELENRTDPLVKMLNQLHGFIITDMAQAVAYLAQVVKTLEAYAAVAAPGGASALTATENKADIPQSAGDFSAGAVDPDGGKKKP